MKNFTKILMLAVCTVLIGKLAIGQEQRRQWVYEFSVVGVTSVKEATKLDSLALKKYGIYFSSTNYDTKKVTMAVVPGLEYKALRGFITASGFVPSEKYEVKEETVIIDNKKE